MIYLLTLAQWFHHASAAQEILEPRGDNLYQYIKNIELFMYGVHAIFTGDPLHSRALAHSRAPLFTQPCPGRTMSTAVCIYVAGLCASFPAV